MSDLRRMKQRLLDISYENKLSHIGSCLGALPIIARIYATKRPDDVFILSAGHAGLALYVVLEDAYPAKVDAVEYLHKYGIHPCRNEYVACSTGSLGQGITVAVGMALASRERNVHVLLSDGECAEGSVWEALAFTRKARLNNLFVDVMMNGWSALDAVDTFDLNKRLTAFYSNVQVYYRPVEDYGLPFLHGLDAHYHVMTESEYETHVRGRFA